MEIKWHPEAQEDLSRFEEDIQRKITDSVEALGEKSLGENTSLFSKQGLEIFRLKLKDGELGHRVFFDINDGIEIFGVEHRDDAYTTESIERLKSRL